MACLKKNMGNESDNSDLNVVAESHFLCAYLGCSNLEVSMNYVFIKKKWKVFGCLVPRFSLLLIIITNSAAPG